MIEYSICGDCLIWQANGDDTGFSDSPDMEVHNAAVRTAPRLNVSDVDLGFSWHECDSCHDNFGGERFQAFSDEVESLTAADIEAVWGGYVECALWADAPRDEDGFDADFTEADIDSLRPAVVAFVEANADDFDLYMTYHPAVHFGHDLWLTQNHHGAGFWDRGLGELGKRLTTAAHAEGSVDLYLSDDGIVRAS